MPRCRGRYLQGGVVISMTIFETRFCFVSSHLAAHLKHLDARNNNVRGLPLRMHRQSAVDGENLTGVWALTDALHLQTTVKPHHD